MYYLRTQGPSYRQRKPQRTSQNPEKDSQATADGKATEVKLPYKCEAIIKDADSPVDKYPPEKLYNQLKEGVFLNQRRKKYWCDEQSRNCFMLFARDLSVTWAENKRYWHWPIFKETTDVFVDAAQLLEICWLEINGKFGTENLSPETDYEVIFLVMLKDPASGWDVPVQVNLTDPKGSIIDQHEEILLERQNKGKWIDIRAGEFRTSPELTGDIQFSLSECKRLHWKRGLVIKGVAITPKSLSFGTTNNYK